MRNLDFEINQFEGELSKDANPETLSKISGYASALEEVNMYCESNKVPLSRGFGAYVMDDAKSEVIQDKFMSPLIAEASSVNNSRRDGINDLLDDENILIGEKADIVNDDITMVKNKLENTWDLYRESFITSSNISPMMAAIPPVQYLETIQSNGRLVIDHKSTDKYTFRKKRERRYLEVDGERKYFPDVVKDSDFMDSFLNHSQPEFDVDIATASYPGNSINLITNSGVSDVTAAKDSLYPEMKLTEVTISAYQITHSVDFTPAAADTPMDIGYNVIDDGGLVVTDSEGDEITLDDDYEIDYAANTITFLDDAGEDGTPITIDDSATYTLTGTIELGDRTTTLKENNDTIVTQHQNSKKNPQFFVSFDVDTSPDEDGSDTTEFSIGGSVNFETGALKWQTSDYVTDFSVTARISGGRIAKVSTVGVEREPMDFVIKERINMALSYDPKSLRDFGTIENTDGMMKLTSTILDLGQHVKDHKVFQTLEEYKTMLAAATKLTVGTDSPNDWFEADFYDGPVDSEAYRPNTPINWREDMLPDTIDGLLIKLSKKFNAKNGIKNVIYGDPQATRLMPKMVTVISKDKEYAGVAVDYGVFGINIKGSQVRVVSTERAKNEDDLTIVPRSNDKEQETFTFYQHYSKLIKDNSIRDINNIHLPSIAYIDTFDVFAIHAIMANVNITESDGISLS